jgi:hypothetical protein
MTPGFSTFGLPMARTRLAFFMTDRGVARLHVEALEERTVAGTFAYAQDS